MTRTHLRRFQVLNSQAQHRCAAHHKSTPEKRHGLTAHMTVPARNNAILNTNERFMLLSRFVHCLLHRAHFDGGFLFVLLRRHALAIELNEATTTSDRAARVAMQEGEASKQAPRLKAVPDCKHLVVNSLPEEEGCNRSFLPGFASTSKNGTGSSLDPKLLLGAKIQFCACQNRTQCQCISSFTYGPGE